MRSDVRSVSDPQRLRPENSEVYRLLCDNAKIKELTGYAPEYPFETGLKETVAWFNDHHNLSRYKEKTYNQ